MLETQMVVRIVSKLNLPVQFVVKIEAGERRCRRCRWQGGLATFVIRWLGSLLKHGDESDVDVWVGEVCLQRVAAILAHDDLSEIVCTFKKVFVKYPNSTSNFDRLTVLRWQDFIQSCQNVLSNSLSLTTRSDGLQKVVDELLFNSLKCLLATSSFLFQVDWFNLIAAEASSIGFKSCRKGIHWLLVIRNLRDISYWWATVQSFLFNHLKIQLFRKLRFFD